MGIEKGIEKGERLGKLKTAQNLLAMGLTVENIALATGLSVEEVKSLPES